MKIIFFLTLLVLSTFTAMATVRTVSNSPVTLAQYNTIQAAIDASASGDTVYVHGSGAGYAGATIQDKKIALIGPGWSPNTNPALKAFVGSIVLSGTSDHSLIQGLYLQGNNQNPNNGGIGIFLMNDLTGISIIRNAFTFNASTYIPCHGGTFQNFLIEGNYYYNSTIGIKHNCFGTSPSTFTDVLVTNNVFVASGLTNLSSATNFVINHNLFYSFGTPFSGNYLNISNNIFVGSYFGGFDFCNFTNNITYNCYGGVNAPWTIDNNTGTGNIENEDPNMVDQIDVNNGVFNLLLDFTIPSGYANDAGTDGKDLGLLFDATGFLNWTNSRNSKLPVVNQLTINSSANPGGNLEIHLKATQAK